MTERREFFRFPKKGIIHFRVMNLPAGSLREEQSIYTNISGGGLLFETAASISPGTILKLEIELPGWSNLLSAPGLASLDQNVLKVLSEVVHCREIIPNHTYHVGVKFVGIDAKHQQSIILCLERLSKDHD